MVSEAGRIVVVGVADLQPIGELPIDGDAVTEAGWLDDRLLVLRRYADHAIAQLWDPPALVADLWLNARLRLAATAGGCALVAGALGSAVIAVEREQLVVREWPRAVVPDAAGAAAGWFAVATLGRIEAWDPVRRAVVRSLVVGRDEPIWVGGTAAGAWRVTQAAPSVIEQFPWRDGATERWDCGAPLAQVASHPSASWLACLDRDGRVHVAGRGVVAVPGLDRGEAIGLAVGERAALLVARGRAPIAAIELGEPRYAAMDAIGPPRERVVDGVETTAPDARWREAAAGWARAVASGWLAGDVPEAAPIAALAAQLGVSELAPVLVLLYGAHLAGHEGAALGDVARVLGSWDALGGGALVARGLATVHASRVQLGAAVRRRLDELP